jgi:hypothetical protein
MSITNTLYPQGNFLNIRSNAPTPRDYNIQVTDDLVRNLQGGAVKDFVAPAAAATFSLPYDAIQAMTRTNEDDINRAIGTAGMFGPKDISSEAFGLAYGRERPLSTAIERLIGASGPLADRLSGGKPLTVNDLIGLDYERLRNPISPNQNGGIGTIPQQNFNTLYPEQNYGTADYVKQNLNVFTPTAVNDRGISPLLKSSIPDNLLYEDMNYKYLPSAMDQYSLPDKPKNKKEGIRGLFRILAGLAVPGLGFALNAGRGVPQGILNLNQRIQGSNFGQATSLADYLDMMKYGGAQGRMDAATRTMAQARGLQKQIDQRPTAQRDTSADRGMGQVSSAPRSTRSGISSSERGAALHG